MTSSSDVTQSTGSAGCPLDGLVETLRDRAKALEQSAAEMAVRRDVFATYRDREVTRLEAKAEGVWLALSFVEEAIRG